MYDDYHARGYEPMTISVGEEASAVLPYARQYSYTFLLDAGYVAWNLYKMGNSNIPLNYVIDTNQVVVNSIEAFDEPTIRGWIEANLAGVAESQPARLPGITLTGSSPARGGNAVRFSLPKAGNVTLRVYSTSGALVRTLCNGQMPAGANTVNWNLEDNAGKQVGNGLYLYELATGLQVAHAKVSVVK